MYNNTLQPSLIHVVARPFQRTDTTNYFSPKTYMNETTATPVGILNDVFYL